MTVDITNVAVTELATKIANLSIEMAQAVGMNQSLIEQLTEANEEIKLLRTELGLDPETGEALPEEEDIVPEDTYSDYDEYPADLEPESEKEVLRDRSKRS